MVKKYLLSTVAALALGFVVSCDNTTDDPPNQNKNNSGNGTTITGPRILSKVTLGTLDGEEYITNSGKLSQVFYRNTTGDVVTGTVTYTGNNITQLKVIDNKATHTIDNTYSITYTSGKISAMTMDQPISGGSPNHSDFTVTYDANGQLYRIIEKKKIGGSTSYSSYTEYRFTFSASNIVKIDHIMAPMTGGNPVMTSAITSTYAYDNFDDKINPYTTLSKEYFAIIGTLYPTYFVSLSSNNPGKVTVSNSATTVSASMSYVYDSQNYPTLEQNKATKYIYKPL